MRQHPDNAPSTQEPLPDWGLLANRHAAGLLPPHLTGLPVQQMELFAVPAQPGDPLEACGLLQGYGTPQLFFAPSPTEEAPVRWHLRLQPEGLDLGPVDKTAVLDIWAFEENLPEDAPVPLQGVWSWSGVDLEGPPTYVLSVPGDRTQYLVTGFRNLVLAKARVGMATGAPVDDASLVWLCALGEATQYLDAFAQAQLTPVLEAMCTWLLQAGVPEAWRDCLTQPGWNTGPWASMGLADVVRQTRQRALQGALPMGKEASRPRM